ncbi:gem (nuclear organelle) associated protein 2 [Balamuthia mandrillaris]
MAEDDDEQREEGEIVDTLIVDDEGVLSRKVEEEAEDHEVEYDSATYDVERSHDEGSREEDHTWRSPPSGGLQRKKKRKRNKRNKQQREEGATANQKRTKSYDQETGLPLAFEVDLDAPLPNDTAAPPVDGMDYLRRVRWESLQSPKVVVSRVNPRHFDANQTFYVTSARAFPAVPPAMRPSPSWQEEFMAAFTALREELNEEYARRRVLLSRLPSFLPNIRDEGKWRRFCLGKKSKEGMDVAGKEQRTESEDGEAEKEGEVEENENREVEKGREKEEEKGRKESPAVMESNEENEIIEPAAAQKDISPMEPHLSVLLRLDQAAIYQLTLYHVTWAEASAEQVTEVQFRWLFALLARLDAPVEAGMASALHSLLFLLANQRSSLQDEKDERLAPINILITILDKCFGQREPPPYHQL